MITQGRSSPFIGTIDYYGCVEKGYLGKQLEGSFVEVLCGFCPWKRSNVSLNKYFGAHRWIMFVEFLYLYTV